MSTDRDLNRWHDALNAVRAVTRKRWPLGSAVTFTDRHEYTGTVAKYEDRVIHGEPSGVPTPGVVVFVPDDGFGEPILAWMSFEAAVGYGLKVVGGVEDFGKAKRVKK